LAKSLDSEIEIPAGATMISKNAELMAAYIKKYHVPADGFVNFAINAHRNALTNPNALFHKPLTAEKVLNSREIFAPIRLMDCSPICEGAAAVILAPRADACAICPEPVHILASSVATDRFRIADRPNPLDLAASAISAETAFQRAHITCDEIDFFELHDAFSIMACLQLEAVGFAEKGQGWRVAADGDIFREGRIPIATMGGLKARGHPIGASAIYQTCEIVQQLTNRAGENQLPNPTIAMLQSIGGAAATVLTHIFGV
ncbi:MAG TPA: thiolase domain-containing protein, partial [Anaerolineae bacterium]|nr:thiolase domain-containing protein [Anaerolineae bacterium]